ncbi:MAG: LysR family transcriptional regulator [Polyangiales bacterium]
MTDESWKPGAFDGLTFERIESFLAVADAGGIAKAAPNNPSRQSQLSRQMREVSEALGFEVLERKGRGVELTADGQRVRALFRELATALDTIKRDRTSAPVRATLAAGDSVLRWVVLPSVHGALVENPRVDLSLLAVTNGYRAVRDGEFDMAISRARRKEDGIKTTRVGSLRYALFAPRAFKKSWSANRSLKSLPFVHVTGAPDLMQSFEERAGAPRVALRCETFPQAALAVRSGHYSALLPALAASEFDAASTVALELDGLSSLSLPLALVARERRLEASATLSTLYRAIAKQLERALRE